MTDGPPTIAGSWVALRRHTPARIAIGRAGFGLPAAAYLDFQAAHARARDAVHAGVDVETLMRDIARCGLATIAVQSAAADRRTFLKRPDLGRRLAPEAVTMLSEPMVAPDVAIVIGDGLSGVAVERNAMAVLAPLCRQLREAGRTVGPVVIATQARVALADHVGELLQARVAVIMLGERPGLSAADSLGMYLTYAPRVGCLDSERNCISNIHSAGMAADDAASAAFELLQSMLVHQASGVALAVKRRGAAGPA